MRLRPLRGSCCPIDLQDLREVLKHPDPCPCEADKPRERLLPAGEKFEVVQQQMQQQPRPYLPLHGVLVRADEIAQLQSLLKLLEERLDRPPRLVKFADGPCAPREVVRYEHHGPLRAVHFDHRLYAAEHARVLPSTNPRQARRCASCWRAKRCCAARGSLA